MDRVESVLAELKAHFDSLPVCRIRPEVLARWEAERAERQQRELVEQQQRAAAGEAEVPAVADRESSPAEAAAAAVPPWSLREYQAVLAGLPAPTPAQMSAFAEFVCGAHSWYKHLPLLPPGRRLHLYLDPAAGMALTMKDSRVHAFDRTEPGFHYSWIPTAEYRERFGWLAFSQSHGTVVYRTAPGGGQEAVADDTPVAYDPASQALRRLPDEVLHAGRSRMSGLVHRLGVSHERIAREAVARGPFEWPEDSGGARALADILERSLHLLRHPPSRGTRGFGFEGDSILRILVTPEIARQKRAMVMAMRRVCALAAAAGGENAG